MDGELIAIVAALGMSVLALSSKIVELAREAIGRRKGASVRPPAPPLPVPDPRPPFDTGSQLNELLELKGELKEHSKRLRDLEIAQARVNGYRTARDRGAKP